MATIRFTNQGQYTAYMSELFRQLSEEQFSSQITRPNSSFDPYIDMVYQSCNQPIPKKKFSLFQQLPQVGIKPNNTSVALAYSGGKDSVALLLYLLDTNYAQEFHLYHATGLNRAYPNEKSAVQQTVNHLQKKYPNHKLHLNIDQVNLSGKVHRAENPTKNHLILARMIDTYSQLNITQYFLGTYTEETTDNTSAHFGLSDSYDLYKLFQKAINHTFPSFRVYGFCKSDAHAHAYIFQKDLELTYLCDSCLLPNMYLKNIRKTNETKYNITIPQNRCYSCWKCAQEALELIQLKIIPNNPNLINNQLIPQLKKDIQKVTANSTNINPTNILYNYISERDMHLFQNPDLSKVENIIADEFQKIISQQTETELNLNLTEKENK